MAEQAKAPDDADAYRGLLTHYDAKISLFKEIHPYLVWANSEGRFLFLISIFGWCLTCRLLKASAKIQRVFKAYNG